LSDTSKILSKQTNQGDQKFSRTNRSAKSKIKISLKRDCQGNKKFPKKRSIDLTHDYFLQTKIDLIYKAKI